MARVCWPPCARRNRVSRRLEWGAAAGRSRTRWGRLLGGALGRGNLRARRKRSGARAGPAAAPERHWEPMARAAHSLASRLDLEVVAVRASGLSDALFPDAAKRSIRVVDSGLHSLLATADLAFVASGTATLEAAICGAPMIVVYKTSPASFAVGRRLVQVPWISLVNLVAQEPVVPELLQGEFNAE